jgi:hypothetical protein
MSPTCGCLGSLRHEPQRHAEEHAERYDALECHYIDAGHPSDNPFGPAEPLEWTSSRLIAGRSTTARGTLEASSQSNEPAHCWGGMLARRSAAVKRLARQTTGAGVQEDGEGCSPSVRIRRHDQRAALGEPRVLSIARVARVSRALQDAEAGGIPRRGGMLVIAQDRRG